MAHEALVSMHTRGCIYVRENERTGRQKAGTGRTEIDRTQAVWSREYQRRFDVEPSKHFRWLNENNGAFNW